MCSGQLPYSTPGKCCGMLVLAQRGRHTLSKFFVFIHSRSTSRVCAFPVARARAYHSIFRECYTATAQSTSALLRLLRICILCQKTGVTSGCWRVEFIPIKPSAARV